jgi:hypothetical protein
MTEDFTYRGVHVQDVWPSGARFFGSQTRHQARRREDGAQRWAISLPTGKTLHAFTQREIKAVIRLLRPAG